MTNVGQLISAIVLVAFGGLFAATDAALSTVSIARVEELVREERPGAVRLLRLMVDRPRYINLIVLLRMTCEVSATVLMAAYLDDYLGVSRGLMAAAAIMTVVSFVVVGDDAALLGEVDDLAQFDLRRERAVAETAPRRQRIADEHQ